MGNQPKKSKPKKKRTFWNDVSGAYSELGKAWIGAATGDVDQATESVASFSEDYSSSGGGRDSRSERIAGEEYESDRTAAGLDYAGSGSMKGGNEYTDFASSMSGSSLLGESDVSDYINSVKDDEDWNKEFEEAWSAGGSGYGSDKERFARDYVYQKLLEERGFGDRHTRDQALKLSGLKNRDPNREDLEKSPWQEDMEKSLKQSAGAMMNKQALYGGNRISAGRVASKAMSKLNSMAVDKIREARLQEGRAAENALDSLIAGASKEGRAAAIASEQLMAQFDMQRQQLAQQDKSAMLAMFGTILSTAIMIGMSASDERLKQKTGETQGAAYDYLDKMETAQYNMPTRAMAGQPTSENGVMAQSLEGSELGRQAVGDAGGVKTIETIQGLRATMVAQKELHERLKGIEQRLGVNFGGGTR